MDVRRRARPRGFSTFQERFPGVFHLPAHRKQVHRLQDARSSRQEYKQEV